MENIDVASRNINLISENLVQISEKANRGQGLMGKLFADTLFSRQLDSAGYNLQIITETSHK